MTVIKPWLIGMLALALAGCSTPRGAGFEREVLAATDEAPDGTPVADFGVVDVTRDILPVVAHWPQTGRAGGGRWIPAQNQPANVMISPGDVLELSVWDAEENSLLTTQGQRVARLQEVQVGADGRIFIPFVGEMRVAGMAPGTARTRIEEELVGTVPSAQVQLSLVPGRNQTANLVSGVNRPGVYALPDRNTSLLEVLADGGGVRQDLTNPRIKLFRGRDVYETSVARLFDDPARDTVLRGGDRVIVEEEERSFLSLGAANRQAVHTFPDDHVTALEALAIIGGVEDTRANPQGILIMRSMLYIASGDARRHPTPALSLRRRL